MVIQKRSDLLGAWRDGVTRLSMLFVATVLVLAMLGGAFHWQAAKAAEADTTLAIATERLDKALDRGQLRHVGLGRGRGHDLLVEVDV